MKKREQYFAAIKNGNSQFGHWLIGLTLIVLVYLIGTFVLFTAFTILGGNVGNTDALSYYFLLLASFSLLFFGIIVIQRHWHQRTFLSLLTHSASFRWGNLFRASFVTLIALLAISAVKWVFIGGSANEYTRNPDLIFVAQAAIITLLLIPFQAAAEEILFRGDLSQFLIKYLGSPWVVFVVSSVMFSLLHFSNSEADGQAHYYLLIIFSFGMLTCLFVYFEGGLESAIGLHIANNMFVFSLVGYEVSDMPLTALYNTPTPQIDLTMILMDVSSLFLIVLITLYWNQKAVRERQLEK